MTAASFQPSIAAKPDQGSGDLRSTTTSETLGGSPAALEVAQVAVAQLRGGGGTAPAASGALNPRVTLVGSRPGCLERGCGWVRELMPPFLMIWLAKRRSRSLKHADGQDCPRRHSFPSLRGCFGSPGPASALGRFSSLADHG